jgi:hypothetical protein
MGQPNTENMDAEGAEDALKTQKKPQLVGATRLSSTNLFYLRKKNAKNHLKDLVQTHSVHSFLRLQRIFCAFCVHIFSDRLRSSIRSAP